jgi:chromosome segregation ATPase
MTDDIIARLRSRSPYLDGSSAERIMDEAADEIERWKYHEGLAIERCKELEAEIERLRAALEKIEEETERTCQQCRLIENIARAALEPKP